MGFSLGKVVKGIEYHIIYEFKVIGIQVMLRKDANFDSNITNPICYIML